MKLEVGQPDLDWPGRPARYMVAERAGQAAAAGPGAGA